MSAGAPVEPPVDRTLVGRAAATRFRRPGPGPGRLRPPLIGSVAAGAQRFAAGVARPVEIRRSLHGPAPVRATRGPDGVRPPRWWRPVEQAAAELPVQRAALPARGLRRVVDAQALREKPAPGRMGDDLVGRPITLPRQPEVAAAGPMLAASERSGSSVRRSVDRSPAPSGPAPSAAPAPTAPPAPAGRPVSSVATGLTAAAGALTLPRGRARPVAPVSRAVATAGVRRQLDARLASRGHAQISVPAAGPADAGSRVLAPAAVPAAVPAAGSTLTLRRTLARPAAVHSVAYRALHLEAAGPSASSSAAAPTPTTSASPVPVAVPPSPGPAPVATRFAVPGTPATMLRRGSVPLPGVAGREGLAGHRGGQLDAPSADPVLPQASPVLRSALFSPAVEVAAASSAARGPRSARPTAPAAGAVVRRSLQDAAATSAARAAAAVAQRAAQPRFASTAPPAAPAAASTPGTTGVRTPGPTDPGESADPNTSAAPGSAATDGPPASHSLRARSLPAASPAATPAAAVARRSGGLPFAHRVALPAALRGSGAGPIVGGRTARPAMTAGPAMGPVVRRADVPRNWFGARGRAAVPAPATVPGALAAAVSAHHRAGPVLHDPRAQAVARRASTPPRPPSSTATTPPARAAGSPSSRALPRSPATGTPDSSKPSTASAPGAAQSPTGPSPSVPAATTAAPTATAGPSPTATAGSPSAGSSATAGGPTAAGAGTGPDRGSMAAASASAHPAVPAAEVPGAWAPPVRRLGRHAVQRAVQPTRDLAVSVPSVARTGRAPGWPASPGARAADGRTAVPAAGSALSPAAARTTVVSGSAAPTAAPTAATTAPGGPTSAPGGPTSASALAGLMGSTRAGGFPAGGLLAPPVIRRMPVAPPRGAGNAATAPSVPPHLAAPDRTGPSSASGRAAPPAYAASATSTQEGTVRRSLADTTAGAAGARTPSTAGGPYAPVIRRWGTGGGSSDGVSAMQSLESPAAGGSVDMDVLVERVVEAIEQRVVEELERRGRRHLPEVF